jgi:DNA-binding PadR family transcriptional regulator
MRESWPRILVRDRFLCDLLKKIWIEQRGAASETYYRITEKGLTDKKALLRIYD